jgi:hypothetical protein
MFKSKMYAFSRQSVYSEVTKQIKIQGGSHQYITPVKHYGNKRNILLFLFIFSSLGLQLHAFTCLKYIKYKQSPKMQSGVGNNKSLLKGNKKLKNNKFSLNPTGDFIVLFT